MEEISAKVPEISVVIPVYNTERYLEECVISLMGQSLSDIEYIFIDDCSSDGSYQLLENLISRFPQRKDNIRVIRHSENKGISFTRNEGNREARGKWVIHCDSDDYLPSDAYETLLNKAKASQADIIISAFHYFGNGSGFNDMSQGQGPISNNKMIEAIGGASDKPLHGALWNKLIKRSLWEGIEMPEELSYCEDVVGLFKILSGKEELKIEIIPDFTYNYRLRENSLIGRNDEKRRLELKNLITILEDLKEKSERPMEKAVNAKIVNILHRILKTDPDIKEFSKEFNYYSHLIDLNQELKYSDKVWLRNALQGNVIKTKLIGVLNKEIRRLVKKIKEKVR